MTLVGRIGVVSTLLVALGGGVSATGCGESSDTPPEIVIGSHYALESATGAAQYKGVQLAIAHFQEDTNFSVRLAFYADEDYADHENGIGQVVRDLVEQDGIMAITGGYGSSAVAKTLPVAEELKVPYLTSGAVADELTSDNPKYFFRINDTKGYAQGVAGLLRSTAPDAKVGVLSLGNAANVGLSDQVVSLLQSTDEGAAMEVSGRGELRYVSATDSYGSDATCNTEASANTCNNDGSVACGADADAPDQECVDAYLRPIVDDVMAGGETNVLMVSAYSADYLNVLGHLSRRDDTDGLEAFVGTWAMAQTFLDAADAKGLAEGLYGTTAWEPGSAPMQAQAMEQRIIDGMHAQFDEDPDYLVVLAYVDTMILLEAIKRVVDNDDDLSGDNIATELRKTDFVGPTGLVQFDKKGDPKYYVIRVFQYDAGSSVRNVVFPSDVSKVEPDFPKVPWR